MVRQMGGQRRHRMARCWSVLAVVLVAVACGRTPVPVEPGASAVDIVDDHGQQVRLAAPAARIASLSPALTEAVFAVGCGEALVLRDRWSDYPAEASKVPAVDALAPSSELILAARPDVVLASFPAGKLRGTLEAAGLPWVGLSPQDLSAVGRDLERVGTLCGRAEAGRKAARALATALAATAERIAGAAAPRVYLELDHAAGGKAWTPGVDTFAAAVLRAAGGRSAFDELRGWPQIGTEAIVAADPDVVLLAWPERAGDAPAQFAARPGLGALRAVREGRVYRVDAAIFGRPGPRVAAAVATLAALLHPNAGGAR